MDTSLYAVLVLSLIDLSRIFLEIDKDHSGELSFAEFEGALNIPKVRRGKHQKTKQRDQATSGINCFGWSLQTFSSKTNLHQTATRCSVHIQLERPL